MPVSVEGPVPHNRWDLLERRNPPHGSSVAPPKISVVVTHYEQAVQLTRVLYALTRQTVAPTEIVVADDGSKRPPVLPPLPVPASVVTQPDLGFRAAAARNLGASVCSGDTLVFLDADTIPDREFLFELTGRARSRDALVVGRRRHADLAQLPVEGDPSTAPRLTEPGWLRTGYRDTRNLLEADGRSFRFVISAVMACGRDLFIELGGFDERFVGYGGEDWDFAYRAWNSGALLIHEPGAVAWHDGPEWSARPSASGSQDRQSLRLAALVPEPSVRGVALPGRIPDVLVDIDPGPDVGQTVRCVHSLLGQRFRDLQVRVGTPVDPGVAELYDGNVRVASWTDDQLRRARARLQVRRPLPAHALGDAMRLLIEEDIGQVDILTAGVVAASLRSTRAVARARRWEDRFDPDRLVADLFGVRALEVGPPPPGRDDLAGYFQLSGDPPAPLGDPGGPP